MQHFIASLKVVSNPNKKGTSIYGDPLYLFYTRHGFGEREKFIFNQDEINTMTKDHGMLQVFVTSAAGYAL